MDIWNQKDLAIPSVNTYDSSRCKNKDGKK